MPELTVRIQVLHFRFHDICGLDAVAGFERFVDDFSRLQILDFDAIERLSFAGFYEFVLNDHARIAFDHDPQSRSKFVSAVIGHFFSTDRRQSRDI